MTSISVPGVGVAAALLALSACIASHRPKEDERPPASPAVVQTAPVEPAAPEVPPAPPAPTSTTATPPHTAVPNARPAPTRPKPATAPQAGDAHKVEPAAAAPATHPPPTESPKAPSLDLKSLEQRLKDTRAIGVFTKLTLKNQVDDLLAKLRAFHNGSSKTPQTVLRQKYDMLIMKVLSLLQDGDPQLATAVASSRDALWGILMDPQKFPTI